jgi:hypothetical protein
MRIRSSSNVNAEFGDADWPSAEPKKTNDLFRAELETTDDPSGLAFENKT